MKQLTVEDGAEAWAIYQKRASTMTQEEYLNDAETRAYMAYGTILKASLLCLPLEAYAATYCNLTDEDVIKHYNHMVSCGDIKPPTKSEMTADKILEREG
jgi:hypothetical protein